MEVYNKGCFKNINPCLQKSSSSGFVTVQDNELKPVAIVERVSRARKRVKKSVFRKYLLSQYFPGCEYRKIQYDLDGPRKSFLIVKVITSLFFVFMLNFLLSTVVPGERGLGSAVGGYER